MVESLVTFRHENEKKKPVKIQMNPFYYYFITFSYYFSSRTNINIFKLFQLYGSLQNMNRN